MTAAEILQDAILGVVISFGVVFVVFILIVLYLIITSVGKE